MTTVTRPSAGILRRVRLTLACVSIVANAWVTHEIETLADRRRSWYNDLMIDCSPEEYLYSPCSPQSWHYIWSLRSFSWPQSCWRKCIPPSHCLPITYVLQRHDKSIYLRSPDRIYNWLLWPMVMLSCICGPVLRRLWTIFIGNSQDTRWHHPTFLDLFPQSHILFFLGRTWNSIFVGVSYIYRLILLLMTSQLQIIFITLCSIKDIPKLPRNCLWGQHGIIRSITTVPICASVQFLHRPWDGSERYSIP